MHVFWRICWILLICGKSSAFWMGSYRAIFTVSTTTFHISYRIKNSANTFHFGQFPTLCSQWHIAKWTFNHFTLKVFDSKKFFRFYRTLFCLFFIDFPLISSLTHKVDESTWKMMRWRNFCCFLSQVSHCWVEWIVNCLARNHNIVPYQHDLEEREKKSHVVLNQPVAKWNIDGEKWR